MTTRVLFFLLAILATARADEAAEAALREMERAYAALSSYSDTSSAQFTNPDGAAGAQVEYRIWFQRPDLFRIDAVTRSPQAEKPLREVLWSDGEDVRTWSSIAAVTVRAKVQLAGSKMFGTYAYHIPSLLQESYGGPRRLHQLEEAEILGEETIDGTPCVHLRGKWQNDPYEIWLGQTDHLVRKIAADYSGYRMEELHREISINAPIAKSIFAFAPEDEIGQKGKSTPPPLPGERRARKAGD